MSGSDSGSPFKGFDVTNTSTNTAGTVMEKSIRSGVSKRSDTSRKKIELEIEAAQKLADLKLKKLQRITEAQIEMANEQERIEADVIKTKLMLQEKSLSSMKGSQCSNISNNSCNESLASADKQQFIEKWMENQRRMNQNSVNVKNFRDMETLDFKEKNEPRMFGKKLKAESMDKSVGTPKAQPQISNFISRQSFNKELPCFYGDPMEWPMFFSYFEEANAACCYSDSENMCRLQKCLKGAAREAVQTLLIQPQNVRKVIETLKFRFGRPDQIIFQLIENVKQLKSPRDDKLESLMVFATSVQNLSAMLINLDSTPHLMNPQLLGDLVSKLPPSLQLRWGEALLAHENVNVQIDDFSDWLMHIAKASSLVVRHSSNSTVAINKDDSKVNRRFDRSKKYPVFTTQVDGTDAKEKNDCACCDAKDHKIYNCRKFNNLNNNERWDFVKKNAICFSCLVKFHRVDDCKNKKKCNIDNCIRLHHSLLHYSLKEKSPPVEKVEVQTNCHTVPINGKEKILFKIVPVKLFGPTGSVDTYAFLDDGSSVTLLEDGIARQLGFNGRTKPLCLKWTGDTRKTEVNSQTLDIRISGNGSDDIKYLMKDVRTVASLDLPSQSLDVEEMEKVYPHLRGLLVESLDNAVPGILIGVDQVKLGITTDVKQSDDIDVVAVKTRIGWMIYGKSALSVGDDDNQKFSFHICNCEPSDQSLHQMTKKFFSTEDFGVKPSEKPLESVKDEKAVEVFNLTTTKLDDQHFETGLLWNSDVINLPKSRLTAERRLHCIEKKMDRNGDFSKAYCKKIDEYVEKGYAVKLSIEESKIETPRTWYLPHFGVVNPNKPDKLRLVFDAAAKSDGVSLNDVLLTGPDRYNSLLGVLFKFRQGKVAICGDIREMFHQVRIRDEDLTSQRFLWRGTDRDRSPDVYVMKVMIFGSASSPFCAQEIKNKNAKEQSIEFPEAADAIINKHYVDDYLDSFNTDEEALKMLQDVTLVHSRGGFEITNWITNSPKIVETLQMDNKMVKNLNFDDDQSSERVLGMFYNLESDQFQFKLKFHKVDEDLLKYNRKPTKREVLRILMSIFDPIGFLGQFTVYMKILLQSIWASGIGWDDVLPDSLYEKWKLWMDELPKVKELRIPRCYTESLPIAVKVDLHVFVDASEAAFAAVAYMRIEDVHGNVQVVFVGSKNRVAPQKMLSIPRLELQAAVLGTRLAKIIEDEHSLKFHRKIFWSDSRTVLCWLNSDARSYKQFVGHRISECLDASSVHDWRWIPTKLNVADDCTKWVKVPEYNINCRWYAGPEFLRSNEVDWPLESKKFDSTEEERRPNYVGVVIRFQPDVPLPDVSRFSKYERYLRTTAWVCRFISNCYLKSKKQERACGELQIDEIRFAEEVIFKKMQFESYKDDIGFIRKDKFNKNSSLIQLSPYLDEKGILRARGRIDSAPVLDSVKRPIILDRSHPVTSLLIDKFHRDNNHYGVETVVNEIRQKFWIPQLRAAVKKVKLNCQICKNLLAQPKVPEMGSLPPARVTPVRPFYYTGVDYFGPIEVKVGRRHEKRWGVLFTCLTIRAVHIEIAHSLSTDSYIMCFRNFIARRGTPHQMFSDNGTNFKGAERELEQAVSALDKSKMMIEYTSKSVKWTFIPPAAPHMGGAWERLVQSVKKVLMIILKERYPSDESLRNLLMEAEKIVNSRPLTHEPIELDRDEMLTPNHFLIGISTPDTMGQFDDSDLILSKQWKATQQLANHFWKRWLKEYLPSLIRREKWNEKIIPIKCGSLVIMVDDKLHRNCWMKGVVTQVFPGSNNQVRVAEIRTISGLFKRPVAKLIVLDVEDEKK